MYCTYCDKLVSEKMAIRKNFCPYCGRRLHWYGIPEVDLSKPILQAILKRKNFLIKQRIEKIDDFYFHEKLTEIPLLELQDALEINPNNIKARFQLAIFYYEKKQTDKSKKELYEVLKIEKNNVDAFFYLANIAVEEENFQEAIKYCDKILELEPNNVGAQYNRAVGYYFFGDLRSALQNFRQILIVDPENKEVQQAINEIVSKLN